ncbi:serine/threonine-protein kinase [Mycolicibacterium sp. BiH015]|uniref:serine/threonine-protein kinase n=1 Tax=Mycolicibacterium sp. BiH015 TaxID=3018808 RepID=UPI0022DE9C40|nr:serine/threonine-protein kinase [Mycolicibacterium sp. BiH015]MDA2893365.1 serine/threonine-protein kinase [Mycolicibacterium sp. BiH015]
MALSVGSVVAGYTIEGILGQGGMGTVYRARNPTLPRSDALKVLSAELSADPQFRVRFEREAEMAAALDHPNIVTIYARGETDGQLWIAMQYVAGSDADRELKAGRMTPQRAVRIIAEVGKALDYAHRRYLLHRDVKPANFLLGPGDERVFLADFGIARALDEAVHLTQSGAVMASVAYAAPETLAGEMIDGRSDVYSLGCSLYRLLTGEAPFSPSGGLAGMVAAHLTSAPPRVTDAVPTLPRALDDVIARAMAKNPDDRFRTAAELADAAAQAISEITVEIGTTPAGSQTAPWETGAPPAPSISPPHPGPAGGGGPPAPRSRPLSGPAGFGGPPGSPGPSLGGAFSALPPLPPRRPWWRRPRWIAATVAAVVVVASGVTAGVVFSGGEPAPGFAPQTFSHSRGVTEITTEPHAVAALGPGDAQAILVLGVQPVAVVAKDGVLPSYEQRLLTGDARIMADLDTGVLTAARPDLIIDTAPVNVATYNTLALIAPTVTRPQGTPAWTWQEQLQWIARMLGRTDTAEQLLDRSAREQAAIREQHPAFDGRTVEVVHVSDARITVALADSPAAQYLSGLGFGYRDSFSRGDGEVGDVRTVPDAATLNVGASDVRIVLRTDARSGGGSYNGLPEPFSDYRGATIIVDDPTVIAALEGGGYAATEFLNGSLVDALSRQVR